MRRALSLIVAVLTLALPAAAAGEAIRLFATEIQLETEDTFSVVERITYDFGGQQRHGIYRDIPVRYGRGRAADYRISLDVESVTDESGIDQLAVKAKDNAGSGWKPIATHSTSGGTEWRRGYLIDDDFTAAGVALNATVQLRFIANDDDPKGARRLRGCVVPVARALRVERHPGRGLSGGPA